MTNPQLVKVLFLNNITRYALYFIINVNTNKISLLTQSVNKSFEILKDISYNSLYAEWLLSYSSTPLIYKNSYEINTVYELLFNEQAWYQSNEHTNELKYYNELFNILKDISKFHNEVLS